MLIFICETEPAAFLFTGGNHVPLIKKEFSVVKLNSSKDINENEFLVTNYFSFPCRNMTSAIRIFLLLDKLNIKGIMILKLISFVCFIHACVLYLIPGT